jgi:MFS family permease
MNPTQSPLATPRVLLFALAVDVLIADLYYVRPLTALLSTTYAIPVIWGGYLVTATQLGYVLGILLIIPLSDIVDRRRFWPGQPGLRPWRLDDAQPRRRAATVVADPVLGWRAARRRQPQVAAASTSSCAGA